MANGGGEKDFVDELLGMARSLDLEKLPSSVVDAGRRVLIDVIGCMLAGITEERLGLLADEMSCASARPASTIFGSRYSADAAWAALVNATAAVWHDLDPGHRFSGGNPAVYPAAAGLAVAEREGASGKRLLEAFIGGYELGARTGLGTTLRGGMDPHGSWPIVGGAVAAAVLTSRDDASCFRHAVNIGTTFNIASSCKAILDGASIRSIYAGFGSAMGVVAADLAQDGFTAERDGLSTVFGTIAGEYLDVDKIMESLGQRWEIERGYQKRHAGLRELHPALDALIPIARDGAIPAGDIQKIEVRTYDMAAAMNSVAPENPGAAKASIPWAVGAYLALGTTGPAAYSVESLSNGKIRDLAARVQVWRDPALDARTPAERPAVVKVCLRDGGEFVNRVERASGEFDTNPLSDDELKEKFLDAASLPLGVEKANQALDALGRIEEIPDIRRLTILFQKA